MLRREDSCAVCATPLPAGVRASWDRCSRSVTCLRCKGTEATGVAGATHDRVSDGVAGATPDRVDDGAAGASAMREYERRRASRQRRLSERYGVLGGVYARISSEPATTASWKQGAEGEQRLARRLTKLVGPDVRLLHDRRMPRSRRANIDHVAVGPGGVTVIDAKALHGAVRTDAVGGIFSARRKRLLVAGRDQTRLVEGVEAQRRAIAELLADGGHGEIEVRSALCFVVTDGLPWRRLQLGETVIDGPKRVAALARRDGALGTGEVEQLHRWLATALPPA